MTPCHRLQRMAKTPRILTGQVAAITGAARGIGKETARAFVREGMKVAIGDLDLATAQETARELGGGTIALELNVHGVLFGMKEILPRFRDRGRGHLVNIASSAGKGGFPGGATYCGTKHFVVGVSEAVRGELRGTSIEVSCVMPGIVNTELAQGLSQA